MWKQITLFYKSGPDINTIVSQILLVSQDNEKVVWLNKIPTFSRFP